MLDIIINYSYIKKKNIEILKLIIQYYNDINHTLNIITERLSYEYGRYKNITK